MQDTSLGPAVPARAGLDRGQPGKDGGDRCPLGEEAQCQGDRSGDQAVEGEYP